jgi:Homeodomain-like domain
VVRKTQVQPSRQRLLEGAKEAHLIALRCSQPPAGQAKWTLKLLAETLVALDVVETISYETVRQTLKKTRSNRTCTSAG